jgi:hypothetical protein
MANVDGRTTEATVRHLRSALARLVPGGRLVAITGASFAPDAPAWADTFSRLTASAHLVFSGAVAGAAFAKHGTSFETRISVFDKCRGGERGGITADLRQTMSPDAAQLLSRITAEVPPRLELDQVATASQDRSSLFPGNSAPATRKAIGISRASPVAHPAQAIAAIEAEDLAYTLRVVRENDDTSRLSDAIYETFRLQAINIPGAEPHPTKLVQSAAMASRACRIPSDSGFPSWGFCDSLIWPDIGGWNGQGTSYGTSQPGHRLCRGGARAQRGRTAFSGIAALCERHGHSETRERWPAPEGSG